MYAVDPEENAALATIDALIEAGLLCVFLNEEGAEIRGYGRSVQITKRDPGYMPVTRDVAVRIMHDVTREYRRKIRDRENAALRVHLADGAVESGHE